MDPEIIQQKEGKISSFGPTEGINEPSVAQVLPEFLGNIKQVPPMYSALKRDGRPLYELARQGIEVEREARPVTIHEINNKIFIDDYT